MRPRSWMILILLAAALRLEAVKTEWVSHHEFQDFAEGDSTQVEVSEDGFLRLGPAVSEWVKFQAATAWAVEPDGKGGYYVSLGNEGKIMHADASGKTRLFHQAKEINIYALETDADGNLYCGTSPDGKVYKISRDGKAEVWFEPAQKYIWALHLDGAGRLYVGTGEKGILYRVTGKGKGEVFYDSDEKHIRSLFVDSKGRLWAGSDPEGIVFRFDDLSQKGASPRVLYDSKQKEVKAFAEDDSGNIYVAVMGEPKPKSKTSSSSMDALKDILKDSDAGISLVDVDEPAGKPERKRQTDEAASEVVRITPEGEAEVWGEDSEGIYSLAAAGGDRFWIGTSDSGKFYSGNSKREYTLLGQLEAGEVVAFAGSPKSKNGHPGVLLASHPAGLWRVETVRAKSGQFESVIVDAKSLAQWGRLVSSGDTKGLKWSARSGNTSRPDKSWSDWDAPEDGRISSPSARYLQYKLEFDSPKTMVDEIRVYFRPFNRRPAVSDIQVNQPGVELAKQTKPDMPPVLTPSNAGNSGDKPSKKGASNLSGALGSLLGGGSGGLIPLRRPGWRSVTWQAKDPDSDTLDYKIVYRPTGRTEWQELVGDHDETFYSWDASTWPDGEYVLRITASDAPSNVAGEEKTDSLSSDFFLVDNSAPGLEGRAAGDRLKFTAKDAVSIIQSAELSINGGPWRPILCDDGILDEKEENFTVSVKDLKPGSHYAILRVKDQAENEASVTIKFNK